MSQSPYGYRKVGADIHVVNDREAAIEVLGGAKDAMPELGTEQHAKILRKMDWHFLPLFSLLCQLSFLARINIGDAADAGMSTDLNLVGLRYNIAAAVFFVPYCLAQVPSNILMKLVRPSRWLPTIMLASGLVMTMMCLVKTYSGLVVARFFLGLAEAGLFSGVTYYFSSWYPRAEQGKRIAMYLSGAIAAAPLGSFLADTFKRMEGIGGLHGWQWLFCLEGAVTVLLALASFFFMHDFPETASFLTETERRYLIELLKADSHGLATHYNFRFVLQALMDYKTYLQCGIFIGLLVPSYTIELFTPTIISALGSPTSTAQLLTAFPFIVGCTFTAPFGILSARHRLCGPYVIAGASVALIGYILLHIQTSPGASYAGAMLAALGVYPAQAVSLAWVSSNAGGDMKRGVAIAAVIGFANLGGICSSFIYFDPPRFHVGHATMIGFLSLSILLASVSMWNYNRINKQKERKCREHGITNDCMDEFKEIGDDTPLFRYAL